MIGPVFERFADESPMSVMTAILIARVFTAEKIDALFEEVAEEQYTQDLLFSTVFDLMQQVVCAIEPSVHAAYQTSEDEIEVSVTSVYNKLNAVEPGVSAELVRYSGEALGSVVQALDSERPAWLEGYSTKVVDGHCLEATEHRIGELREEGAAPLPGKALAILDPELGLITDVVPCEDGHAQERRLLEKVLRRAERGELWMADRNFATRGFLIGLAEQGASFVIREHANLPWEATGPEEAKGRAENGELYEQPIRICDGEKDGSAIEARRIRLVLDEPTRDGDTEIVVLTNVPAAEASAEQIADLYRGRWTIEQAFQQLAEHLETELETLGYPDAALFGLAVGMVSYNVMSVLKAALASVYGWQTIEEEVSGYYIATELSRTYGGMMVALPPERWAPMADRSASEVAELLQRVARKAHLPRYQRHPRGPKKPSPNRTTDKHKPHVATARLLAQRQTGD